MLPAESQPPASPVPVLQRRLERERAARREAEAIAERVTSELYETVQQLTRSTEVAQLLADVAAQANEAESVGAAVAAALAGVCAYTGWPLGHAFVRSTDEPELLVSSGVVHVGAGVEAGAFVQETLSSRFRSGEGLPGRVLATGEAAWIAELAVDCGFVRQRSAADCGLSAAFATPVRVRNHTAAVLEFFAPGIRPPDEGLLRVVGFVGAQLGRVFEREAAEARLVQQAMYDGLTGLPNRVLLVDRLQECLAGARRSGLPVHVLYLDVDDFKSINDSRGHAEGDAVLVSLAHRLSDTVARGSSSCSTVARLGGDEFAVLLEGCDDVGATADRIHELLRSPLRVDDHEVYVSVSIGSAAAELTEGTPTADVLLAAANVAMHVAKRAGKSRHTVFEPRMQDEARHRHVLGEELRYAYERNEFFLAYQPVVDLGSGDVVGAEALVRWEHPEHGTVMPDEFISRAEESGLIVGIGTWVLGEACRQAAQWRRAGAPEFTVAVNVSGRQLRDPEFVAVVREALSRSGLHPSALCLEMTESILMERDESAVAMLTELRVDGVHLAIDDFGTGYSSLGALRRLPVDLLKIDRSFISSLPEDDDAGTIAWAVVRLGHTLGLPVLAEGVETEEQRATLLRFGCDQAQGYLFGRPVPATTFASSLLPGVDGPEPVEA